LAALQSTSQAQARPRHLEGDEPRLAEERTFTEAQHFALLTDAVARETASLSTVKEELEQKFATAETEKAAALATVTELQTRIDVLDAEKAAAETARDAAIAEVGYPSHCQPPQVLGRSAGRAPGCGGAPGPPHTKWHSNG
jgi:peptidoglycan hydrolase CwlO-like protein